MPWKSGASAPRQAHKSGTPLQPPRYPQPRCHPERSMRIRLMNPRAQSKDPFTPDRASAVSGSSPGIASRWENKAAETHAVPSLLAWIGHSCPMPLTSLLDLDLARDLVFDREGREFHSCRMSDPKGTAAS